MRLSATTLVTVLLAATGALTYAQTPAQLRQPMPPVQIARGVYYVGTQGISSFLFTSPQGHVLVDAGFESTIPLIEASMKSLGFSPSDIRLILVGHAHPDHVAGLHLLQSRTGARIIVGQRDAATVAAGSTDSSDHWPGAQVSREVADGESVNFGPWHFTAVATPGHTPGCTSWRVPIPDGDSTASALFVCSTSVPAGTRLLGNAAYPNILHDYASTFARLMATPCGFFFHEHPQGFHLQEKIERLQTNSARSPFYDPAGCRANIDEDLSDFLTELSKETRPAPAIVPRRMERTPALDVRLQGSQNGEPVRFKFTADQRDALVAYLKTLTDKAILSDPRFSDPFSQLFRRPATHNR